MNENARVLFEKKGRAAYISHLDLMHTLSRVFVRAGVKIKHTEGFNPHPYMSIAIPLSVCCESECELMDFVTADYMPFDEIRERLNNAVPEGIKIIRVYKPETKVRDIKWIEHTGVLEYDSIDAKIAAEKLNELFSRESLVINKKTKHGFADVDMIPNIKSIRFEAGDKTVNISCIISGQEPSVNPNQIITAITTHMPELTPDFSIFCRKNLYFEDMKEFR